MKTVGADVISFNNQCLWERGQWEEALDRLHEKMADRDIEPDVLSYSYPIEACFPDSMRRLFHWFRVYEKREFCSVFVNRTSPLRDIHGYSLCVACMLVADSLWAVLKQEET